MSNWKTFRDSTFRILALKKFDIVEDDKDWLGAPAARTVLDIDEIDVGNPGKDDQLRLRSDLTYHVCHLPEGYAEADFNKEEPSPLCVIDGLSINRWTNFVIGTAHFDSKIAWEIVQIGIEGYSEDTVVASGTGSVANFEFYGSPSELYEIRFS